MKLILTIGLLVFTGNIFAQEQVTKSKELLNKVIEHYKGLDNLELKMDYLIFDDQNSNKITEQTKGHYIKQGNSWYLKQHGNTMIKKKDDLLIMDNAAKIMVFTKFTEEDNQTAGQITPYLKHYSQIESLSKQNGVNKLLLTIDPKTPSDIEKVELEVEENSLQIKSMTLFYRKKFDVSKDPRKPILKQPKMKLVYWHFDATPKVDSQQFELDQFFTTDKNGKMRLTAQYQSYEFIHQ